MYLKGTSTESDTFCGGKLEVFPTGYGKSLCYAVLLNMLGTLLEPDEPSIVVVVTPLTAIVDDKVCL